MQYKLFEEYASCFESVSTSIGAFWVSAIVVLTVGIPIVCLCKTRSIRTALPVAVLSLAVTCIVLGCYTFERNSASSVSALLLGGVLLCGYAFVYGLAKPTAHREGSHADLAVGFLIALVTVIKCTHLEEWPPLLNDYAAMTGVSALKQYLPESVIPVKPKVSGYLESGGPSPIHAPLLHLLFEKFGYSSFAVRAAEVVGSTATLIFLWMWLRITVSRGWGMIALGLFAMSSEHLSQSRMGTFFSISQALSVCTLWLWTALCRKEGRKAGYWIGLAVAMIAIGYCYVPARATWVFCAGMFLTLEGRKRISRARLPVVCWLGVAAIIGAYSAFFFLSTQLNLSFAPSMLATDAPVWLKDGHGNVSQFTQPPWSVMLNIFENMKRMVAEPSSIFQGMETIYVTFSALLLPLSIAGLWSPRWRFISSFVLCGLLPGILTFPIPRRTLMARPFSAFLVALFVCEYARVLRVSLPAFARGSVGAIVIILLGALPLQGLHLLARFNGPIGVGPSFGPEYASEFIRHLKELSHDHSIVLMNPGLGVVKYEMAFARELYIERTRHFNLAACSVQPTDTKEVLPQTVSPTVYAVLNEESRAWVVPWLESRLPGITMRPYERNGHILYWLGIVGAPQR